MGLQLCPKELHINAMQRYAHAVFQDGLDQPSNIGQSGMLGWT
jgi:hypothetical protein